MQLIQVGYARSMTRWMLFGGALLAIGCTKANPAAKCSTGTCIDPAYPFCDVDGSLTGSAGSCISVSCTPGDFKECRGDVALTCNAMGNNYDELQCSMGCTPEANGCKLCQAGQTVCTNGEVQTCDANGAVTSSESCPLGCFASQPRCRDIDPSNGLAQYADMVMLPPDITLTNATIDTGSGGIVDGGTTVNIPSFDVPAPNGGVPIRVYVVNTLTIVNATVHDTVTNQTTATGYALAFVAKGKVAISGQIKIAPGTGGIAASGCDGGYGRYTDRGNEATAAGGGGGANASVGGKGGNCLINGGGVLEPGGASGMPAGTSTLTPLRGGCPGGASQSDTGVHQYLYGAFGGGAVQISSSDSIEVTGSIDASGALGILETFQGTGGDINVGGGGGAGGAILLEAPTVTLGPTAVLNAAGGLGGAACATNTAGCSVGGAGATNGVPAAAGVDVVNVVTSTSPYGVSAGGGGGGLGRIRINTSDQTYTKANTTVEDGDLTVGTIATR